MNKSIQIILIVVAMLMAASCGGDSLTDFSGGGSISDLGGPSGSFIPDETTLPDNSVSLRQGAVLGDLVTVEVWGENIALPTFIARFGIRFEPAVAEFVGFEPGDFIEQNTAPNNIAYTVPAPAPGAARVDVEIKKFATPLGSQEDGVLVKLQFRVLTVGATGVEFANPMLGDANGAAAQGVTWIGGRLEGS